MVMTQRVSCRLGGSLYRANIGTETAVAYTVFKEAEFQVQFATETGNAPKCDERMISGISGKLLVSIISSGNRFLQKAHALSGCKTRCD